MTNELYVLLQVNQQRVHERDEVVRSKSPSINLDGDAIDLIAIVVSVLFLVIVLSFFATPIIQLQIALQEPAHAINFPIVGIDAIEWFVPARIGMPSQAASTTSSTAHDVSNSETDGAQMQLAAEIISAVRNSGGVHRNTSATPFSFATDSTLARC